MGSKKGPQKEEPPANELEDDEYEVEAPIADEALMAMMPMSFGKQDKKQDLSASFAKTKRVVPLFHAGSSDLKEATKDVKKPEITINPLDEEEDESDSDDMIGPSLAEAENVDEEDEDEEEDDEDEDEDEFPVSHEIVLKDHTKVPILLECADDRLCQHLH